LIFVSPATDEKNDIVGTPDQFSAKNANRVVFHNMHYRDFQLGRLIHSNNYVSRVWGGDDINYCKFVEACINHSAYDDWNQKCLGMSRGIIK